MEDDIIESDVIRTVNGKTYMSAAMLINKAKDVAKTDPLAADKRGKIKVSSSHMEKARAWLMGNRKIHEDKETLDEISDELKANYREKAEHTRAEAVPFTKKGEYKDLAKSFVTRRNRGLERLNKLKARTEDTKIKTESTTMIPFKEYSEIHESVVKELKESGSPFDLKNYKSQIDWSSDGPKKVITSTGTIHKARLTSRNAETGGAAEKKSVGRPEGNYDGAYKIDKAKRDSKEYKDALSAKVRKTKADGFAARKDFKTLLGSAIKARQAEIHTASN